MKLISSIFFMMFALGTFTVSSTAQDPRNTISKWTELSRENTLEAADQIYAEAIEIGFSLASQAADTSGASLQTAAHLYFKAAELCRELRHAEYPITLFQLAVAANPESAHYRRVYGDYLSGYRGLFDQAWQQYRAASELLNRNMGEPDEAMSRSLNLSYNIFHRDAGDGPVIFSNDMLSISAKAYGEYSYLAKNIADLTADYNYFVNAVIAEPYIPFNALDSLDTSIEKYEASAAIKLRPNHIWLPTVKFNYVYIELPEGGTDFSANGLYAGRPETKKTFDILDLELAKNFLLYPNLALDVKFNTFFINSNVPNYSPATDFNEDTITNDLEFALSWHRAFGNVTKLTIGGNYSTFDNIDSNDDSQHGQRLIIRNSQYFGSSISDPDLTRYQGRRSRHFEAGILRRERAYRSDSLTREEDMRMYFGFEELGLLEGILDVYSTYSFLERYISEGSRAGTHTFHKFEVNPIWVPIYKLYDNDFVSGWQLVNMGAPIAVELGDGPYDRILSSLELDGRYVIKDTFAIRPSIGFEYSYYSQLERDSVGGYFRLSFE